MADEVIASMAPHWGREYGNPSSQHLLGRTARNAVEHAREQVAALIHCQPEQIVFTSGGTESNNLALIGRWQALSSEEKSTAHFVSSEIEHPATLEPLKYLAGQGAQISLASSDQHGRISVSAVQAHLRPTTQLVSIMLANNETGVIQPIEQMAECCRDRGIVFHTDAAQAAGKIPVHVEDLGVDLLTIAGHKLQAPKGIGALYVRESVRLGRVLFGASQERGLSPGTECVPLIVGLGQAAVIAARHTAEERLGLQRRRDRFIECLRSAIGRELIIHGESAQRLPNTISVNFPDVVGADLLAVVPEVMSSTGAACHTGDATLSGTLRAMGLSYENAKGTVRVSLGWETTQDEVELGARYLVAGWKRLTGK